MFPRSVSALFGTERLSTLYALVHTGGNAGLNTIVILLPESKSGMIVFTNGERGDQLYEKLISETFDLGSEIINRLK